MDENTNPVYTDASHGKSRELLYSFEKDGQFKRTVGFHGEPDRVILQQAWDHFHERIEDARQRVIAGKVSPIVYYMEKFLADPLNLSMMVGMSIFRVKLHFMPFFFNRLGEKTLKRYADAFNITVEELKNVDKR